MRALLVVVSFSAVALAQSAPEPVALFDGTSLRGWSGDPAIWRVEDGCLVGRTAPGQLAGNAFLVLQDRQPANFEFRAMVRMQGDSNGGVQYRSRALPGGEIAGYQLDLHAQPNYTAMLYDERGAGIVAERGQCTLWRDGGKRVLGTLADSWPVDLAGSWHEVRIVAMGDLVWHVLDGEVTTCAKDERAAAPRGGVLALQLHGGGALTLQCKDLTLREFADDAAMRAAVPVPKAIAALLRRESMKQDLPAGAVPQWLWDEAPGADEELFFRRTFTLAELPRDAQVVVACDNHCRVFVNGEKVGEGSAWERPVRAKVQKALRAGENVVAVHGWNEGGPAALAVRVSWVSAGKEHELVSDAQWLCHGDDPDGWNAPGFAASGWQPVKVLGAMGDPALPWSSAHGKEGFGAIGDPFAQQVAVLDPSVHATAAPHKVPMLRLLDVPRALGTWVSLASDPQGRLYAGAQGGGLYRVTPAKDLGELTSIERVPVELDGAHGLLWWRDALYAVVNERNSGLYRLTDRDGDGMLEHRELLQSLQGSGEHGPHSVVVAPDGEHLLVVAGNQTQLPKLAKSRVALDWKEDRLVPRLDEPHQYTEGISPPGGWVCQCTADGKDWELLCCGFRNPYDLVVRANGQVVTYDSDMEWDMGLPWYRPTRLLEVIPGVDYGWRIGSGKWPADYPECPSAIADIGPGSPTGMAAWGEHVMLLDWTFGTAYVAQSPHLRVAPALVGAPWPLADVCGDYFVAGGRGLPSTLSCVQPEFRGERFAAGPFDDFQPMRHASDSREVRARAFTRACADATERGAVLAAGAAEGASASVRLTAWLVRARTGTPADLAPVLDGLGAFAFASLPHLDRIAWLRAHALALLRLGPANDAQRAAIGKRLLPLFPTGDEREDQDLCELLAYVDAPGLLDQAIPQLAALRPSPVPAWANVREGSDVYGSQYSGVIAGMASTMPPIGQLAIANALRLVKHGWTLEQRRTYFTFLKQARARKGGASYDGFVKKMIDAMWATCSPGEQQALAELVGNAKADAPAFASTPPKGPGSDWQVADIDGVLQPGLASANLASGRNLFHAAGCAACHYFAGEGGNHGPDLTSLGNKFTARDVLESILAPSAVISEQYSGQVLTKQDGSTLFGFATRTFHGDHEVYEVMPATAGATVVRVPVGDVRSLERSPLSPMPTDLVDRLSALELRDLLAFLLSRGAVPR